MTPTLEQILRTSDRAGLRAWLERPAGLERMPGHWTWQGPVDADLGRDLCAAAARTTARATPALLLSTLIGRLANSRHVDAGYAGILCAVAGHAHHEGHLTTQDGLRILGDIFQIIPDCDRDVPQEACLAILYELVAHHVPCAAAVEKFARDIDAHEAHLAQTWALLAIYGPSVWPHIHPLVQRGHAQRRFSYLAPAERPLAELLVSGSAHALMPLFAHMDACRLRAYAPQTIQHHLQEWLRARA